MTIDPAAWPANDAPGAPGIPPTWTSSSKDLVGTAIGPSRIWFTLGYGILNEIYYPRVDIPQVRDLGFIVADGKGFWSEVKRLNAYEIRVPEAGVPAPTIVHRHARFELRLRVAPDPHRDALLIEVALSGDPDLKPYVLLAPHLGGTGWDNIAAAGKHYGRKVLWAEQGPFGLALAAADRRQGEAFGRQSAGYVGHSDGWQDFAANRAMTWTHDRAGPGNVALLGEVTRDCVLALGFGPSRGAAASLAAAALAQDFDRVNEAHSTSWKDWHRTCHGNLCIEASEPELEAQFSISRMVLRCHMDKTHVGAMVASLSVPWGNTKDDRGGYHLVWPRDLVECATALLGVGGVAETRDVLRYLIATQHEDGHWNQNQWLGGTPFWQGVQLDEAALPVILAALLDERGALDGIQVGDMVRRALSYVMCKGPVTDQDRWEEDRGINAFTLAASIAALAAGAAFLEGEDRDAVTELADTWNTKIEDWLYARHSAFAQETGVEGHYVRMAPPEILRDADALGKILAIKNREQDPGLRADAQISTDFLQLVRYGLRSPDAACVRNSIAVIDAALRIETPAGSAWYRYNGDGYGEHADGREFDGTGIGRPWPLLTGERGHYELLAGNDPTPMLRSMCAMTDASGMLPEQVWDEAPIPARNLYPGKPTGSAMPLAWTHAEFVKLMLSSRLGASFDCPRAVRERYRGVPRVPQKTVWSENAPVAEFFSGRNVRINLEFPAIVRWRANRDDPWQEWPTEPSLPGAHTVVLPTRDLPAHSRIEFACRRLDSDQFGPSNAIFAKIANGESQPASDRP